MHKENPETTPALDSGRVVIITSNTQQRDRLSLFGNYIFSY